MEEVQIIDQVVSMIREQLACTQDLISYDTSLELSSNRHSITVMGIKFLCIVKNEINGTNILRIEEEVKDFNHTYKEPFVLVARYVHPTVYGTLREKGLNFADTAGNYNILYTQEGAMVFCLSHTGEKAPINREKSYPIFQEAGLKVILYLLQSPENVNRPFREIKEHSGVSIGTVKNVIDELRRRKFIFTTRTKRVLRKRRLLLDSWSDNYHQVLKPKLLLKQLDFHTPKDREEWEKMTLPSGMLWGGECASYLLNGYLTPELFEIYTEVPYSNLMKTGAVNTTEGVIRVYRKFWKGNEMPYPLIYADLVGSGDSRCIEAAHKLLKDEFPDFE